MRMNACINPMPAAAPAAAATAMLVEPMSKSPDLPGGLLFPAPSCFREECKHFILLDSVVVARTFACPAGRCRRVSPWRFEFCKPKSPRENHLTDFCKREQRKQRQLQCCLQTSTKSFVTATYALHVLTVAFYCLHFGNPIRATA